MKEKAATPDKPAQAEVDAILEFLDRCATAFNHGNGYTNAPRVGKMTLDVRRLLQEYCAENGPAHIYELSRIGVDLVRAAAHLIP